MPPSRLLQVRPHQPLGGAAGERGRRARLRRRARPWASSPSEVRGTSSSPPSAGHRRGRGRAPRDRGDGRRRRRRGVPHAAPEPARRRRRRARPTTRAACADGHGRRGCDDAPAARLLGLRAGAGSCATRATATCSRAVAARRDERRAEYRTSSSSCRRPAARARAARRRGRGLGRARARRRCGACSPSPGRSRRTSSRTASATGARASC